MSEHNAGENTDRELWRERAGDYYADSIHVTEHGGIGINCGGTVFVKPLRVWHSLAADLARATAERDALRAVIAHARDLCAKQALDEGLWCDMAHISEAHLQTSLRRLHAVIENDTAVIAAIDAARAKEQSHD